MRSKLVALLCIALTACAVQDVDAGTPEVSVRALTSGLQCGTGKDATIVELGKIEQLGVHQPSLSSSDLATVLNTERVFVISMGTQPTAGYSLILAHARAHVDRDVATIFVIWHTPARGTRTAQVITQPCLIVALEKRQYAGVRVVDQRGAERARLMLK